MNELSTQTEGIVRLPMLRTNEQLLQGPPIKFNNGSWIRHDGGQLRTESSWLAIATTRALQRFVGRVPETILKQHPNDELPDPAELNKAIPREQWPLDQNGKPKPPWSLQFVMYLLEVRDAMVVTFTSSAIGSALAVTELERCILWKRALHGGQEIYPLTKLADAPFKTSFGMRRRPDFPILGWRRFVDGQLRSVEPLSLETELKDSIKF
jgi:hypothetical protein